MGQSVEERATFFCFRALCFLIRSLSPHSLNLPVDFMTPPEAEKVGRNNLSPASDSVACIG